MNEIKKYLIVALVAILILTTSTIYFGFNCHGGEDLGLGHPTIDDLIFELEMMGEFEKDAFTLYCDSIYNNKNIPFDEAQRETRANGYECPQNYKL